MVGGVGLEPTRAFARQFLRSNRSLRHGFRFGKLDIPGRCPVLRGLGTRVVSALSRGTRATVKAAGRGRTLLAGATRRDVPTDLDGGSRTRRARGSSYGRKLFRRGKHASFTSQYGHKQPDTLI